MLNEIQLSMKNKFLCAIFLSSFFGAAAGQSIERIDGTKLTTDSLNIKIAYLMKFSFVLEMEFLVFN